MVIPISFTATSVSLLQLPLSTSRIIEKEENEEEEDLDEEKEDLEDDYTNDAKVEIESIKLQDDEKFEIANSRIAEEMRSEAKQSGPNFKKIGDWKY